MMVDPLPAGAKLVVRCSCSSMIVSRNLRFMVFLKAVFDACNSATLLGKTFDELLHRAMRHSNFDIRSGTSQVQ